MINDICFDGLESFIDSLNSINKIGTTIKTKKLDLSKKEDVDQAKNFIESVENNKFLMALIGENNIKSIKDHINECYAKIEKENNLLRPSLSTPENAKEGIAKLVQEYTSKMIFPHVKNIITDKQKRDIVDSLYEFACWMYNK